MEIIGLLGNAGCGKNYIAEKILPKILPNKNTVIIAFADHFKVDCIIKHGVDYNKVFGEKDFETRKMLQKVGTEEGRNVYGPDIWVNSVANWIKILGSRGVERFIICDCRFKNEVDWIKKNNGTVIKINAPSRHKQRMLNESKNNTEKLKNIQNHQSESEIELCSYDFEINNDYNKDVQKELIQKLDLHEK